MESEVTSRCMCCRNGMEGNGLIDGLIICCHWHRVNTECFVRMTLVVKRPTWMNSDTNTGRRGNGITVIHYIKIDRGCLRETSMVGRPVRASVTDL